jgi:small subunit ribosomal protein S4
MNSDPKCKKCRRAGEKLFLKGDKCTTPKCAMERKPNTPGMPFSARKHRSVMSEYGLQLKEKQKVRNVYRLSESQFSSYVQEASSRHGIAPTDRLFENLETRLDSVVFRLGLASSRSNARQMVTHGHITLNGRRVDIPSIRVKKGDVIGVREGSRDNGVFGILGEKVAAHTPPSWLDIDKKKMEGSLKGVPKLTENDATFNFTQIIEYYSR